MGWFISLNGDNIIWHDGLNPNFSSFMAFCPDKKIGIVILANSNSDYTKKIGDYLIKKMIGINTTFDNNTASKNDKLFSIIFIISIILFLSVLFYFTTIICS